MHKEITDYEYGLRGTNNEVRIANYGLRITDYGLQVNGFYRKEINIFLKLEYFSNARAHKVKLRCKNTYL